MSRFFGCGRAAVFRAPEKKKPRLVLFPEANHYNIRTVRSGKIVLAEAKQEKSRNTP